MEGLDTGSTERTPRQHSPSLSVNPSPCDIEFRGLGFSIATKDGSRLPILHNVTGFCGSCRLTACMGASGAGKSTLLKILACNISGGDLQGEILVNGSLVNPKDFRKLSAVVWQSDVLLSTATVKEALMTSALLKLPQSTPYAKKEERVEQILSELELQHCKHTRIGEDVDGAVSGISGGERRRVSVGIGLVTDAHSIFLDEPTTGLDSDSAEALISLLSHLAVVKRRTIMCTIHQPSSDICENFDNLILLSCGRLLYCGAWSQADAYFAAAGFPRPGYRSTAEHLLTVCKDKEHAVPRLARDYEQLACAQALEGKRAADEPAGAATAMVRLQAVASTSGADAAAPHAEAAGGAHGHRVAFASDTVLHVRAPRGRVSGGYDAPEPVTGRKGSFAAAAAFVLPPPEDELAEVATSHLYQVKVLSARFMRSWWRSPVNLVVQAAQYLFFAFLIGATYWRLDKELAAGTFDRVASLWFVASCLVLQPGNNACSIMYGQKPLLRRELSNGLYHYSSFFIAKSLTSLPFQAMFAALFNTAVYFLVGYQIAAAKFAVFFALMFLMLLISETLGILCAGFHRTELVGLIILSIFYLPLLMFTGFIQTHTPVYFAWIKHVSYVAYGYSGLVKNEFAGLRLLGARGIPVPDASSLVPVNIDNGLSIANDALVMLGILVGMRLIAYFHMLFAIRHHWL